MRRCRLSLGQGAVLHGRSAREEFKLLPVAVNTPGFRWFLPMRSSFSGSSLSF